MCWCTFHVTYGGDEGIDDAVVVAFAGNAAQFIIHLVRVFADQIAGVLDAEQFQVAADGLADVGNACEIFDVGSVHDGGCYLGFFTPLECRMRALVILGVFFLGLTEPLYKHIKQ